MARKVWGLYRIRNGWLGSRLHVRLIVPVEKCGASENNRRAHFDRITRDGRRRLQAETRDRRQTTVIIERFFAPKAEDAV